jgi:hypothetical protein
VGFETTIPAFELAMTFHALECAATVIGDPANTATEILPPILVVLNTDLFFNISNPFSDTAIPYFFIVFSHLPKQFNGSSVRSPTHQFINLSAVLIFIISVLLK